MKFFICVALKVHKPPRQVILHIVYALGRNILDLSFFIVSVQIDIK